MSLRTLAGHTAVYGLSTILSKFLNYLLTPLFTRVLSTADYGVTVDMYALIPFLLVLLTMGLETGYFRFAGQAQANDEKRRLFGSVWGTVTAASVVFLLLAVIFTQPIAAALRYASNPEYIRIVAAIIALDAIMAVPFARLRQEGRAVKFMTIKLMSVVVTLVLSFALLLLLPWLSARFGGVWASLWDPSFGPGYVFVANLAGSAVTLLLLLPTTDRVRPTIDRKILKPVMLYSLPLLVAGIQGTANEYIDRQMIKYLMPSAEAMSSLGIYGAVTKIGVILVMFTQMYRYAAEPFFLSGFKKEDFLAMTATATKYFIIASIGIFLFIAFFTDIFELIIGPDFREGIYLLPIIMVSNILSGVVLNLSFWYKQTGATRFAIYVTGIGLVFTVVFNILLIPVLGILGSALARLGCELTMVAVSYLLNQKHYPIPYDLRRIGGYVLVGGAMYCTTFFTGAWPEIAEYSLNLVMLAAFAFYAVRREELDIRGILKSIVKR